MTLDPCILRPGGDSRRFQNRSPRAAPRGGDQPLPSRASPGPLSCPGPLPRPSRLARHVPCSTPSRNRVSIKLTGMAPSRRQGQETRRGGQRANKPSRALQRPRSRALCRRGPHPARARRQKERGPLPLGDRGLRGPGGGRRDFVPEPPRSPVRFPWGLAPTADQEEEGGEKGTERRSGRDGGPGRVPPSGLGAPEDRSPGLRIWGAGEFTTTTGVPNGVLNFAVGRRRGWGARSPGLGSAGWLWRGRAARTRRGRSAFKSGCAFCSAGWL